MFGKEIKPEKDVCEHDWVLVAKSYAKPVEGFKPDKDLDSSLNEKALMGFTTFVWECQVCKELRTRELIGTDENRWKDIVKKVNEEGMQYIVEDGKTYAVTEWVTKERIKINA